MSDKRTGWLSALKVGDPVIISGGGYHRSWALKSIEKISPSGMLTAGGDIFNADGSMRGNRYGPGIIEASDKNRATIAADKRERAMQIRWDKIREVRRDRIVQHIDEIEPLIAQLEAILFPVTPNPTEATP